MSITTETRFESFEKLNKIRLYNYILNVLKRNGNGMTAREISVVLYNNGIIKSNTRQDTQPRLTELVDDNILKVICKKFDDVSRRNVAVYYFA